MQCADQLPLTKEQIKIKSGGQRQGPGWMRIFKPIHQHCAMQLQAQNSQKMRFGFGWRTLPPILLLDKCGSCGGVRECGGGKGLWGEGLAALSSGVTWGHRFLSKQTDGGARMAPHLNISDTERPKPHQNIFLPFLHLGRQLNTAWNWFSWSLVYFTFQNDKRYKLA